MIKTPTTVFLTIALVSLGGLLFARAQSQKQVAQLQTSLSPEERDRLLVIGKKLFLDRCSKCHDQRGDKPLKTGPPLSERKLSDAEIERIVAGRLKDAPTETRRGTLCEQLHEEEVTRIPAGSGSAAPLVGRFARQFSSRASQVLTT